MNPANDNLKPNAQALFCASCGSASVTTSSLAGGEASCNVCGWKGRTEELAAFHFTHDLGGDGEVLRRFFMDLRTLLSLEFARGMAALLVKWGFMEQPTAATMKQVQQHLARYIAGTAKAIAESVVKTRADIEKEQHRDRPSA